MGRGAVARTWTYPLIAKTYPFPPLSMAVRRDIVEVQRILARWGSRDLKTECIGNSAEITMISGPKISLRLGMLPFCAELSVAQPTVASDYRPIGDVSLKLAYDLDPSLAARTSFSLS